MDVWLLSGRGLCDGPITRPEESYRLCRVIVCDLETSRMTRLKPGGGSQSQKKKKKKKKNIHYIRLVN
jgi:hypothetical protein